MARSCRHSLTVTPLHLAARLRSLAAPVHNFLVTPEMATEWLELSKPAAWASLQDPSEWEQSGASSDQIIAAGKLVDYYAGLMRLDKWGEPPHNWQQDPVTLADLRVQAGGHRLAAVLKSGMAQRFHILVIG